jgi:hypothetical protein
MSQKLPPKPVRDELKKRGYKVRSWAKRDNHWRGNVENYDPPRVIAITANATKAIVEVYERDTLFEVAT